MRSTSGVWGPGWPREPRSRAVVVALAGVLLLAAGCSDGLRIELPREGDVVTAFPGEGFVVDPEAQGAVSEAALEVTTAEPTGTITTVQAINVAFNRPMVEVDGVKELGKQGPFTITPPLEGTFRWLGPRTVSFVPSGKIPMATAFKVVVPATTKSLDGKALGKEHTFEFQTPSLSVVRYGPSWYDARLRPDDKIFIQFNLPVKAETLKEFLTLSEVRQPGLASVDYVLEETKEDGAKDDVKRGTAFFIAPKGGFQTGLTYRVALDKRLTSTAGQLPLGNGWSQDLRTWGAFALQSVNCYGTCPPGSTWDLAFTNPVRHEDITRCLTITPKLEVERTWGWSTHVQLAPKNATPGTVYTVSFSTKCRDELGNSLASATKRSISVGHSYPWVDMDGGMSFMEAPTPGAALKLPITLRNVRDARVQMLRLQEGDLAKFATVYSDWDDRVFNHFKPMVDRPYGAELKLDESKTYGLDLKEVLRGSSRGLVYVAFDAKGGAPGHENQALHRHGVVQVTDLGLTVKTSPESILVWTTSLATTAPLPGTRVVMQDETGAVLWEGKSGADGVATGPGLKTFGTRKPRILVAQREEDLTFLDLEGWSMQIYPWRFGLDYAWDAPAAAVRGHVFTERGVFRPGESAHIKGYMRLDRGRKLELLPTKQVLVTVTDPRSKVLVTETLTLSELGSFDLKVNLPAQAAIGTWSVTVQPADLKDTTIEGTAAGSFRVEAYRAPDFEVVVNPKVRDASAGEPFEAELSGQYLFGAPMGAATVRWSAVATEMDFRPQGYDQYEFGSWEGRFWWSDEGRDEALLTSGEDELGADGTLQIEVPTQVEGDKAVGTARRVTIEAEVRDLNGQVLSGRDEVRLHPADFYIGLQRPGYLVKSGDPFSLDLVTLKPDGTTLGGQKVKVEIKRREWRSVRKASTGGGWTWVYEVEDKVQGSCAATTRANGPTPCALEIKSPGYYVIEATSADSQKRVVATTSSVYAWGGGDYWWGQSDDERLSLVVDKASYDVGDKARVMVQSPFKEARALVTVERRGVIQQWTHELKGTTATVEVPITEDMLPNAYVSVVLVRGRVAVPKGEEGTTVDPGKPSYKVGYTEINVNKDKQLLKVAVEPERTSYMPGEEVVATVTLKDTKGQPVGGEVTFMAVDEGVLSLTGYKTPNPVEALYRRQPLAVITTESRMAVVAQVDTASEDGAKGDTGGGGAEGGEATNYRAAFATTAAFMPGVQVGSDGRTQVRFKLPDNLTAFRLMAVAAATDNRFGSADTRVQVRKSLMVRPALPRFLSAGDTMALRTIVQNVTDRPLKARVDIAVEGNVALQGGHEQTVELAPGASREVSFPASVGSPGEATVKLRAKGDGEEDAVELTLPVRFPAATRQWSESGVVRANDQASRVFRRVTIPEDVREDVGGLDIEFASTAMAELLPGLSYLIGYPYGCVEQTTGRTLPLVALSELTEVSGLPGIPSDNIKGFAQSGVNRLLSMQTWEGGLGYWPGDDEPSPWGSAYGGLALVRASQVEGLEVDEARLERLYEYLKAVVYGEASAPHYWYEDAWYEVQPLAAWTLAMAGRLEPGDVETLYQRRGLMTRSSKALLALAFQEAGADREMVAKLLDEMLIGVEVDGATARLPHVDDDDWYWSWMTMHSDVRANSFALMALLEGRPNDPRVAQFARGVLDDRRGGAWYTTQENAFAVMALGAYFAQTEKETPDFSALVGLGDKSIARESFQGRSFTPRRVHIPMAELLKHKGEVISLVRDGQSGPMYYSMTLRFAEAKPRKTNFDNGFTLMREYLVAEGPNAGKPVTSLKVGEVVKVRLTVVTPEERRYVAIEDPLPAGLEPINTNFATTSRRLGDLTTEQGDSGHDDDFWFWWYPQPSFDHTEQRDDRILLFADVLGEGVADYVYLARATTPGTFAVPSARAEEMYDPNVWGRTTATTIKVE